MWGLADAQNFSGTVEDEGPPDPTKFIIYETQSASSGFGQSSVPNEWILGVQ